MRRCRAAPWIAVVSCALVAIPAATAHSAAKCRAARITGLTVARARQRVKDAGCSLRLRGAKVTRGSIQTVARVRYQDATIIAWVNPLCSTMGAPGPPRGDPKVTPGPTELITGLYLAGGPHRFVSVPDCEAIAGTPGPGIITVRSGSGLARTDGAGALVATVTVAAGHLATIPLAPGTYTVTGMFGNATINEKPAESIPGTVTIPAGHTVRADVVLSIP